MICTFSLRMPKFFASWWLFIKTSTLLSYFLASRSSTFLHPTFGISIIVPKGSERDAAMVRPACGIRPLAVGWPLFPQQALQWQYAVIVRMAMLVVMGGLHQPQWDRKRESRFPIVLNSRYK